MRLGQLARKYNISLHEIISYLKEIEPTHDTLHHNSKLNEQTKTLLEKRFEYLEKQSEETSKEIEQKLIEPKVADIEETAEVPANELEAPLPEAEVQDMPKKIDVVIESDKLLELLESEEVDLSKITLIKAPKRELSGLKVVGKIELPEPKSKSLEKSELREKGPKPGKNSRHPHRQLSEVDLEKRRLKAKKRKKEYQARQEKQRKEKEKKQRKALNKARYQQKMQRAKSNQPKQIDKTQRLPTLSEAKEQPPQPKTLLGRFWRWMNT